jgi:hypothetical protein
MNYPLVGSMKSQAGALGDLAVAEDHALNHPTSGKSNLYTEENMKNCGYALRTRVNFLVLRQLYFRVLHAEEAKVKSPAQ